MTMLVSQIAAFLASAGIALSACAANPDDHSAPAQQTQRDAALLFDNGAAFTIVEASRLTEYLHGEEFILVPAASGTQVAGVGVGVGASRGQMIDGKARDGVWWFPESGIIHDGEGYPTIVSPRTLVLIGEGSMNPDLFEQAEDNGGVACDKGYYACCGRNSSGQWRARCIADGLEPAGGVDSPVLCINGGVGSSGCSNGDSIIAFQVVPPARNHAESIRITPD